MYFIDVIRGKNITFVYHKILYKMKEEEWIEQMILLLKSCRMFL